MWESGGHIDGAGEITVDLLPDHRFPTPEEACEMSLSRDELLLAMKRLTWRERSVLAYEFGFDVDLHQKTYYGRICRSRSYVAAARYCALAKLRHPSRCKRLLPFARAFGLIRE